MIGNRGEEDEDEGQTENGEMIKEEPGQDR